MPTLWLPNRSPALPTGHLLEYHPPGQSSIVCRATAPAKKSRRLRMVVSMLSHRLLEAFTYERVVQSVRCRRWKPMTRRRTWCADRSLAKCCALRVHVTHPYSRVSITSAFRIRTFRLSGAVVLSYNSGPNRLKHAHMRRFRRSISNER